MRGEVKDSTIFAMAKLAELRDPETGYHLERTWEYALLLARQLQLGEEFADQIYRVGPLHDIGYIIYIFQ
ncbi:MAG: HD domain-containing protein [Bacillota bacterium]